MKLPRVGVYIVTMSVLGLFFGLLYHFLPSGTSQRTYAELSKENKALVAKVKSAEAQVVELTAELNATRQALSEQRQENERQSSEIEKLKANNKENDSLLCFFLLIAGVVFLIVLGKGKSK